ncbi:MAG TPA: hypothetical protein VJH65_00430 [Candidatus Nanoarchaeia archaeon]|nr:hypothetical protein [Candidatus Nanoarchaeia archaeon]
MAEVTDISSVILRNYNYLISSLPSFAQNLVQLFLLVLIILVFAIFIWKFHRFIANKNILELNLRQYSKAKHPILSGLLVSVLYFIEYILIMPFLIFFWFAVFTVFLIVLNEGIDISTILIISAAIIAVIRMTSYYSWDLSKELAKLLPLTMLAVAITRPGFFDFERIIINIAEIFNYIWPIFTYLMFIAIIEIILRFFDFIFSLLGLQEEKEK